MPKALPLVLGIAGGSGCGKTFLARTICEDVDEGATARLSMDQYFKSISEQEDPDMVNFDHPRHIDIALLFRHLQELKAGNSVLAPSYDFRTMVQTPEAVKVEAAPVIVLEGLFVLASPIRQLLDLACFLDVEADQRLLGRFLRDSQERMHDSDRIIRRYQRYVRPSYEIFVAPTRESADIIVDFTYRRSFFTQLLVHIIRDYTTGGFDINVFLDSVKDESYRPGTRADEGAMPVIPDLLELSKAFPE